MKTGGNMMRSALVGLCLLAACGASAAEGGWPWIRAELYPGRVVEAAQGAVTLVAPRRTENDHATRVGVEVALPPGAAIRRVTLVIDENPSPVSAVVDLHQPALAASFDFTVRMNGPSPVRAIVEAEDGRLFMAEQTVKTSGLGACAAPPGVDAAVAMATLGQMTLQTERPAMGVAAAGGSEAAERLRLGVSHPSYSGLQMDQITLLFTPARFVRTLEVWADETPLFTVTGSISLSENPRFGFEKPLAAGSLRVRMTDTEGASFEREFGLGAS
jgi:sulfur-oxidizing protein SoxY